MAYQKLSEKRKIATNLGTFIDSQLLLITQNRVRKNLEDEQKFNKAVLEDNLTLDQQIDFRNNQLKNVSVGDKDERIRLKNEISSLKDRKEQENFTNAYIEELTKLNSGVQSIDSTLKWLRTTMNNTTDQAIKSNIKENISTLESKLYEQRKAALQYNTTYAAESKDVEIIDKQRKQINDAKVQAINAGNDEYASLLDLQLQSLNKAGAEASINKVLLNMSLTTMTGNSATALLNEFNTQLEQADKNIPITIGGIRYESASQFWEAKRGEYLNARSENGFFTRYQSELNEKIAYKSTRNILSNDALKDVSNWYNTLKERPELTEYLERIDQDKQKSLTATAELRGSNILNNFALNLDANKALKELAYIQDTYGVDQSLNYQKIVSSAAKEKQDQVSQILSTMSSIMASSPGITSQQAMETAIKSGAGATVTPEELATKKASDIVTGLSDTAKTQQFGDTSPLTVASDMTKKFSTPTLTEGKTYKLPNDKTVYKYEGGVLRPFTGVWDEATFKQYTGSDFGAVKQLDNIGSISKGTPINTTDVIAPPAIEAVGEKIASPDLLKYYKPEDIITKGTDKFLKSGVKSVLGEKLTGESWNQLQQQYKDPKQVEEKIIRLGKDIYLKQ
jgi:hypothetical protein